MSTPPPTRRDLGSESGEVFPFRFLSLSVCVVTGFFGCFLILRLSWPLSDGTFSMIYLELKTGSPLYLLGLCDLEVSVLSLQVTDSVHDVCQVDNLLSFGGPHPVPPLSELGPESRTDKIFDQKTSLSLSFCCQLIMRCLGKSNFAFLHHESADVTETEADIFFWGTTDPHQSLVNRIQHGVNIDEGRRQLPDEVGVLKELDVHVVPGQVILSQDLYRLGYLISGESYPEPVFQQSFQCCRPVQCS